jgi:hypothetical protein
MGVVCESPFTTYERFRLGRFYVRTSHIDSSYISPFVEDLVLFFRFLLNFETRVSCSLNSSFLVFQSHAVIC